MSDDRPAHCEKEVEITPPMLRAGVVELCRFDYRYEDEESAVARIFIAMVAAMED